MRYRIDFRVTFKGLITVEADDEADAMDIVYHMDSIELTNTCEPGYIEVENVEQNPPKLG